MGNLKNVKKAFEHLGCEAVITSNHETVLQASHVVLPGVGAFEQAMATLRKEGLVEVIHQVVAKGTPFIGICLGMQLLFDVSYENGEHEGLGLLEGRIVRFDIQEKIPHMGWNTIALTQNATLFQDVEEGAYVYFVHSYHAETKPDYVSAYTTYGKTVPIAVEKNNIYGMQFHPEKSSDNGLKMLKRFASLKV